MDSHWACADATIPTVFISFDQHRGQVCFCGFPLPTVCVRRALLFSVPVAAAALMASNRPVSQENSPTNNATFLFTVTFSEPVAYSAFSLASLNFSDSSAGTLAAALDPATQALITVLWPDLSFTGFATQFEVALKLAPARVADYSADGTLSIGVKVEFWHDLGCLFSCF